MKVNTWAAFFLALIWLPACYSIVQRDADFSFHNAPPRVGRLLSLIEQKNAAVQSFKAIGRIRIWDRGLSRTSRAAWLGAADGRLRIEFLGLPGQPVAKFIFDGRHTLFFSHMDDQIYRKKSRDPNLEPVTGVSIKASEVIDLLAGGIPVYEHDSIFVEQCGEPSDEQAGESDRCVLIFKKAWLGVVEKIFFKGSVIEKVEIFKWGDKIYQATLNDIRTVDRKSVPFFIEIENAENQGFSFTVDRQWVDIDLRPDVFEITQTD